MIQVHVSASFLKSVENSQAVVAYAFNPSTWEAETDGSGVRGQPDPQELVPGQSELLHRETLS